MEACKTAYSAMLLMYVLYVNHLPCQVLHQDCLPISSLHCISLSFECLHIQLWYFWVEYKMHRNQIFVSSYLLLLSEM